MNETKKGIILIGVLILAVLAVGGLMISDSITKSNSIKTYFSYFKEDKNFKAYEGNKILVFGKKDCSYCAEYVPIINELTKSLKLEYEYIHTEYLSDTKLVRLLNMAKVNIEDFGTPTTVVLKDGLPVSSHIGYMEKEEILNFLKEAKVVASDTELPKTPFEEIGYLAYETILKSSDKNVVVIGQTNCSHCIKAKPVYALIAAENGLNISYMDYTKLSSEEQQKLNKSNNYFINNTRWGTPLMLVIKDGQVIGSDSGFLDKDSTVKFLKEQGLIGK